MGNNQRLAILPIGSVVTPFVNYAVLTRTPESIPK